MLVQQVLWDIIDILDRLNIPYMLSGSIAFNMYAIPRSTRDIDWKYLNHWTDELKLNKFGLLTR